MGAHVSVLLDECITGLNIKPTGVYVDGTLGRAGHALEIAKRLTTGRLIGIDQDETAITEAAEILRPVQNRTTLCRGNFRDIARILSECGVERVDGMLFDLGVSSPQLDDGSRGFSYMQNAPLDMRMDQTNPITARDIINTWPEERLRDILFRYGEERYANRIVKTITTARAQSPIETTAQLVDLIRSAMPAAALREKQHPAKRTFQALRIAVNDELGAVEDLLQNAPSLLATGGRICVISFHSLEDRIVKHAFSKAEKGCTCPHDFPVCVCGFQPTLRVISRKTIAPTAEEVEQNPRSRSAKLRVAERV